MKTFQLQAKILSQSRINDNIWHCEISAPQIARASLPGQFINIRVSDGSDPLLRRPISIHGTGSGRLRIFYEVVGKATRILSQKKKGESLDIIGPLGNGFNYSGTGQGVRILIAGGMGGAPLIFLAEKLAEVKSQKSKVKTIVLIGAKTKEKLFCVKDFKRLGCDVKIATDDGSSGFKGRVSDLLRHLLSTIDYRLSTIYACGPKPMLRAVTEISRKYNLSCQLSLEEHMACGIGACLGCAIKVKSTKPKVKSGFEYKRVCKDGPVFNAGDIIW